MHGWLILNKPAGITSAKAVAEVKRLLKPKKIGHGGTLDPMATGILPLALGEATKAFDSIVMQQKSYRFTVTWGAETTTDDAEGEVTAQSDNRPSEQDIRYILPQFTGEIMQRPPNVSAIKVKGQRAYALSRKGEAVAIPARPVQVYALELLHLPDADHAEFRVSCGKGTYVRSLARDMGELLGCYGHIATLHRENVGKFHEREAISLDELRQIDYTPDSAKVPPPMVKPVDYVLDDIPAISLTLQQVNRLKHGQLARPLQAAVTYWDQPLLRCYPAKGGQFFALAKPVGSMVKAVRIFNI
jgi:tRNA pseudouridine55 synthase